ncbi:MAG: TolC family protein [SAR324 cluster bacterium]|nr:TolC family protein [SAR324 cluster bacterium]
MNRLTGMFRNRDEYHRFFSKVAGLVMISLLLPLTVLAQEELVEGEDFGIVKAIRITLTRRHDILVQENQIDIIRGQRQTESGVFDPMIKATVSRNVENTPLLPTERDSEEQSEQIFVSIYNIFNPGNPTQARKIKPFRSTERKTYQLSIDKQLRNGIVVTPYAEVTQVIQGTANSRTPATQYSQGSYGLSFQIPLLRLGDDFTTAGERMAYMEEQASYLDLQHIINSSILETVSTYWNYHAAQMNLDILEESEKQAGILLNQIQILVKAGERPKTEIKQLQANLADKTTAKILAEQELTKSKHELGTIMGLPFTQVNTLPPASDDFPDTPPDYNFKPEVMTYIEQALKNRKDLQAIRIRKNAAHLTMTLARKSTRPQIDATINAYRIGTAEDDDSQNPGSFQKNQADTSVQGTLSFAWPFKNNAAHGLIQSAEASYQQHAIQIRHSKRIIRAGVTLRLTNLQSALNMLRYSQNAVELNKEALETERQKLKLGFSTTIDLILMENRLTEALLRNVSAR